MGKLINNFKIIRKLLDFRNPNDFYFLQILKRRKDNPGQTGDAINIDNFYIYDFETFDKIESKVIGICNLNNARAYIRLNKRNADRVALETLKNVTTYIISKDPKAVKNAFVSACGSCHSDEYKTWVVDLDGELTNSSDDVINTIIELYRKYDATVSKEITKIPTMNGLHIIAQPFRLDEFRKKYPEIDVHKDNPTILYSNIN